MNRIARKLMGALVGVAMVLLLLTVLGAVATIVDRAGNNPEAAPAIVFIVLLCLFGAFVGFLNTGGD